MLNSRHESESRDLEAKLYSEKILLLRHCRHFSFFGSVLLGLISGPVTLPSCDANMRGEIMHGPTTSQISGFPHLKSSPVVI